MDNVQIEFKQLGLNHNNDKITQHGYHFYYPIFFSQMRNDSFNLVEIGYGSGTSHALFKEYFKNAKIFSLEKKDIDSKINENHNVLKCDQSNYNDLINVINLVKTAGIIIDDGSHHPIHQIDTFHLFFQHLLIPGGIYIIEDIETSYWRCDAFCYGYRIGSYSFVDRTKKFIDEINSEFSRKPNLYKISSITYAPNCVIIKKQTAEEFNFHNRTYRHYQNL